MSRSALEQLGEVGSQQHGDQNRRTNDRNGQEHLKRGGSHELNRDDGPVCGAEERAALEEQFERHVSHVNRGGVEAAEN
jgi:hypothetical protein